MAMKKPPRLNGPSRPVRVRVPSGMMAKETSGRSLTQAAARRRVSTALAGVLAADGEHAETADRAAVDRPAEVALLLDAAHGRPEGDLEDERVEEVDVVHHGDVLTAGNEFSRPLTRTRTPQTMRTARQPDLIKVSRARPRRTNEPSMMRTQTTRKTGRATSQMR